MAYRALLSCGELVYLGALYAFRDNPTRFYPLTYDTRYFVVPYGLLLVASALAWRERLLAGKVATLALVFYLLFQFLPLQPVNFVAYASLRSYEQTLRVPLPPRDRPRDLCSQSTIPRRYRCRTGPTCSRSMPIISRSRRRSVAVLITWRSRPTWRKQRAVPLHWNCAMNGVWWYARNIGTQGRARRACNWRSKRTGGCMTSC